MKWLLEGDAHTVLTLEFDYRDVSSMGRLVVRDIIIGWRTQAFV